MNCGPYDYGSIMHYDNRDLRGKVREQCVLVNV